MSPEHINYGIEDNKLPNAYPKYFMRPHEARWKKCMASAIYADCSLPEYYAFTASINPHHNPEDKPNQFFLTVIAVAATPDNERNCGVEGGRLRSHNFLAA